jgi:hypothetical protein
MSNARDLKPAAPVTTKQQVFDVGEHLDGENHRGATQTICARQKSVGSPQ